MSPGSRPLFREHALKHYLQKREKDILPRLVTPPIFLCGWFLFCLVVAVGIMAWLEQVPIFIHSSGIIEQRDTTGAMARLFLPAREAHLLHIGEASLLQVESSGQSITSNIVYIEPDLLSPEVLHKHYGFNYAGMPVITEPSVAVDVALGPAVPGHLYAGSPVNAQIQIGRRRVLSLLPGFDRVMGD